MHSIDECLFVATLLIGIVCLSEFEPPNGKGEATESHDNDYDGDDCLTASTCANLFLHLLESLLGISFDDLQVILVVGVGSDSICIVCIDDNQSVKLSFGCLQLVKVILSNHNIPFCRRELPWNLTLFALLLQLSTLSRYLSYAIGLWGSYCVVGLVCDSCNIGRRIFIRRVMWSNDRLNDKSIKILDSLKSHIVSLDSLIIDILGILIRLLIFGNVVICDFQSFPVLKLDN